MPNRWIRFCRRLVPDHLRDRAFDPAIDDLALAFAARAGRARGFAGRGLFAIRWRVVVLGTALACRRLGSGSRPPSSHPTVTGDPMLLTWFADLHHAARRFVRQPLFALVATLTLALGIGANAATFGFVNSYLLAHLAVPDAREIVRVDNHTPDRAYEITSYPNYADVRDAVTKSLDLAAHVMTPVLAGSDESAELSQVELATGNYFRVMRVAPVVGRLIDTGDDLPEGAHPVVVLGETFWRSRFGADRDVIGRSFWLNGAPYAVVGVAPESFRGAVGAHRVDLWAPLSMQQQLRPRGRSLNTRGWGWLKMVGRIAPGSTLTMAQVELDRVSADINRQFGEQFGAVQFRASEATVLPSGERSALSPYLMMTLAFTGLLLVVTCANLAGVMQARIVARRRELAIRQSLGAGRGRLVSEWLAESVLLAIAGGFVGLLLARLTIVLIVRTLPPAELIGQITISAPVDWGVAGFAGALSLLAAVLIGLWPALRAARAQPLSLLKDEVSTATTGRGGAKLRRASVLVQVATSAMLLLASGLLVGSLRNLQQFDPGFRTDHLAMVAVDLKLQRMPREDAPAFGANLLERARSLPGVTATAIAANVPLAPGHDSDGFRIPGYTPPTGSKSLSIDNNVVSTGYFETLGLTFVRGHTWDPKPGSAPAVVINETMAARFWPGLDPVGRPIEMIGKSVMTVAGVVRDSVYYQVGERPLAYIYLPAEIMPAPAYTLLARTSLSARDLEPSLAQTVRAVDRRASPFGATTFEDARASALYPRRLLATAATAFGGLALLLTGVGLYGVVASSVGQRTREIGVRVALGASSVAIQRGVLRESVALVGLGSFTGFAGGYVLAGALRQWLFGVAPFDPGIYAGVALALGLVAIVAAWVPARHAARIDPIDALRS